MVGARSTDVPGYSKHERKNSGVYFRDESLFSAQEHSTSAARPSKSPLNGPSFIRGMHIQGANCQFSKLASADTQLSRVRRRPPQVCNSCCQEERMKAGTLGRSWAQNGH